ncbi:putative Ig domain-containing protein [Burkholderia dolosa]|uniref:Putative Ig domain-containing protein n=3 Tax=Burkholderia TaxID=32008 RepID=A0A892IHI3_9BURK|nr:hypothetical protein EGY28_11130 [Burkholderia dolosa]MBR8420510.1 putative Ig domain-containing protein [Burkholderia dolosa]MBY4658670.1 putative Ig domain-containing protein [Burkholderia dolosa]MBY4781802.1 putative Ig domain-containing protein [Burkholderia dolosa]MBY4786745.1 putative Ig domain-containing protein [Burkholderia dolosa]
MKPMKLILPILMLLVLSITAACNGGPTSETRDSISPPAGLSYSDPAVVYAVGSAIPPNVPSSGGGAITQYSASPALPAGLALDPVTGIISGTPTTVAHATIYTVTGRNAAGSAAARVQIEVKDHAIAPDSLSYPDNPVVYTTGVAIHPNVPVVSGGAITGFAVSPALPAGLALNPQTGAIGGTPTAVTPAADYTVTGSNSAGSISTVVNIEVRSALVPPASLTYDDPDAVYPTGQPIAENTPHTTGGDVDLYTVTPALPDGLSIDASTGIISGLPTRVQPRTVYTVTGSNKAGSISAQIAITVSQGIQKWVPADNMSASRRYHTATLLPDGTVLVAGGYNGSSYLSSAELYHPDTKTWESVASMSSARYRHTATLLPDGTVLVAGGYHSSSGYLSSAELYHPDTKTWESVASMSSARYDHTATLLPDGTVLVAGGYDGNRLSSAELYHPDTKTWETVASMSSTRYNHTATLLPDGTVLVAGGYNGSSLSSAELYHPDTKTWETVASMSSARYNYTATLLPDGTVLVAGGNHSSSGRLSSAELYHPDTKTWESVASMSASREYHTATLLPDGTVLVAGGVGSGGNRLSSAELYHPDTKTWESVASMSGARYWHTATLLPDGTVLVAGGYGNGYLSSAELYVP